MSITLQDQTIYTCSSSWVWVFFSNETLSFDFFLVTAMCHCVIYPYLCFIRREWRQQWCKSDVFFCPASDNRLVFFCVFFAASALLTVPLAPSFLSVGWSDWLITSFVLEGKKGISMTRPFCVGTERQGGVFLYFFLLFLDAPQGLFTHVSVFNSDEWSHFFFFLKSVSSVIKNVRCEDFFSFSLLQSSCRWCPVPCSFLPFPSVQMGSVVQRTAGWLPAYFEDDAELLCQIWVMLTDAVQFP